MTKITKQPGEKSPEAAIGEVLRTDVSVQQGTGEGALQRSFRPSSSNHYTTMTDLGDVLFRRLSKLGEVTIHNMGVRNPDLPKHLKMLIILCPLYSQGSLQDSTLLPDPKDLAESRVGPKFNVYTEAAKATKEHLNAIGRTMELEILFADRGVLISHDPTTQDLEALESHRALYVGELLKGLGGTNMTFRMRSFSELGGHAITKIPQFINTHGTPGYIPDDLKLPEKMKKKVQFIKQHLEAQGISVQLAGTSTFNNILNPIMAGKESSPATLIGLVEQYIASEMSFLDPDILGMDGMFVNAERFSPLLDMPELLPQLMGLRRVDVKLHKEEEG